MTVVTMNVAEGTLGIQIGERTFKTHDAEQCEGEFCCIHNPSDHPLKNAPMNYRFDRGIMERFCECGIGHPDPDDLAFKRRVVPNYENYALGVHGCCGHC